MDQLLRQLTLAGVACTAVIAPDGRLHAVGGARQKVSAAAQPMSLQHFKTVFPRIHTVVIAQDQPFEKTGLIEDSHNKKILRDPHADFHVICAERLEEAIQLLVLDANTRWGPIIDCSQELHDHRDFVGRGWLKARVQTLVEDPRRRNGYVLITGEPGAGKSAFIAEWMRTSQAPVYHFIKKGRGNWDNPEAFFRSLTAQLRRKYSLSRQDEDPRQSAADVLYAVLEAVSRQHFAGRGREVLVLDGLDEAYGPTGRAAGIALPGVLREQLPDGIFCVLTSRPGEHLNWLADPALCATIHLEDEEAANAADIQAYMEARNRTDGLGLTPAFIAEAMRRSEQNFLFAVLLMNDLRTLPPEERTPERIPAGLQGWMVKQLEYVVQKWQEIHS